MRNIATILFLFISISVFGQNPRADSQRYEHKTTVQRDAYSDALGYTRLIFNIDTGQFEYKNGANVWTAFGGGGGLANLVEDLTPELGGDLDGLNNSLTNINTITTNGTIIAGLNVSVDNSIGLIPKATISNVSGTNEIAALTGNIIGFRKLSSSIDLLFDYDALGSSKTLVFSDADVTYDGTSLLGGGSTSTNTSFVTVNGDTPLDDTHVKGPQGQSIVVETANSPTLTLGAGITENKWFNILAPAGETTTVIPDTGFTLVGKAANGSVLAGTEYGISFTDLEFLSVVKRNASSYFVAGNFDILVTAPPSNLYEGIDAISPLNEAASIGNWINFTATLASSTANVTDGANSFLFTGSASNNANVRYVNGSIFTVGQSYTITMDAAELVGSNFELRLWDDTNNVSMQSISVNGATMTQYTFNYTHTAAINVGFRFYFIEADSSASQGAIDNIVITQD